MLLLSRRTQDVSSVTGLPRRAHRPVAVRHNVSSVIIPCAASQALLPLLCKTFSLHASRSRSFVRSMPARGAPHTCLPGPVGGCHSRVSSPCLALPGSRLVFHFQRSPLVTLTPDRRQSARGAPSHGKLLPTRVSRSRARRCLAHAVSLPTPGPVRCTGAERG